MRVFATTVVLCHVAHGELVANEAGAAQEMKGSGSTSIDVCDGRSDHCSVLLDVPTACAGTTSDCPVIMCFHGHGGRNQGFNNKNVHNNDFIGVYPQGESYDGASGCNDGSMKGLQCEYNDYDCTKDPNDGLFVKGIIAAVKELGAKGRFYAYGQSNGANEVQILGANSCEDLPIAGIAADSGPLLKSPERSAGKPYDYNHPQGTPVAQLSIHGDADGAIPYDGGPRFNSDVFILEEEPESDKLWATNNGCIGTVTSSEVPATVNGHQVTTATHFVYGGCPSTAPVEWYKSIGGGHVATNSLDGTDTTQIVFDFFKNVEKAHFQARIVV